MRQALMDLCKSDMIETLKKKWILKTFNDRIDVSTQRELTLE